MSFYVAKTAKLFINGAFTRSESARSYKVTPPGEPVMNVPRASRKDIRNAVQAARAAQPTWAQRTAYNRGQILYRAAEMLSSRKEEFLALMSGSGQDNRAEFNDALDALLFFAGYADKLTQLGGSVNQVAGSYFNFSIPEPIGVVAIISPFDFAPLIAGVAATVCSGNTVLVLPPEANPLPALALGEIFATSDFPKGVINILSGLRPELLPTIGTHRDLNAVIYAGLTPEQQRELEIQAADSVKRIIPIRLTAAPRPSVVAPSLAQQLTELKTVWHPIGK